MVFYNLLGINELQKLPDGWQKALADVVPGVVERLILRTTRTQQITEGSHLGNLVASSNTTEKPSRARTAAE